MTKHLDSGESVGRLEPQWPTEVDPRRSPGVSGGTEASRWREHSEREGVYIQLNIVIETELGFLREGANRFRIR